MVHILSQINPIVKHHSVSTYNVLVFLVVSSLLPFPLILHIHSSSLIHVARPSCIILVGFVTVIILGEEHF
jgi:hypothetical protein